MQKMHVAYNRKKDVRQFRLDLPDIPRKKRSTLFFRGKKWVCKARTPARIGEHVTLIPSHPAHESPIPTGIPTTATENHKRASIQRDLRAGDRIRHRHPCEEDRLSE